jgi:hypothetical protein
LDYFRKKVVMITFQTEAHRRRAIAWALTLTSNAALKPEQYERGLLEQYAQGRLTLDQVIEMLDKRVQHILYRSRATQPLTATHLNDLLEESRLHNAQHQITGLLCYCTSGYFVQVIEGTAQHIHTLYSRIQCDPRHQEVVLLSNGATDTRWFPDWAMAYAEADSLDFFWLISYLEARSHNLVLPQIPIQDELLFELLSEFKKLQEHVQNTPL